MTKRPECPRRRTLAGVACAALAVLAVSAPAVSAAVKPSFVARPASGSGTYFVLKARPGQVLNERVTVINNGKVPGTVHLYAVDATTGQTSGAVYRSEASARRDAGAWAQVAPGRLALAPGQSTIVNVRITVPANAKSGDHLGGFVVEPAMRSRSLGKHKGASFGVKIHTLTIVAIQVKVAGPRIPQMSVDNAKAGGLQNQQQVLLGLSNTGNILFKGKGAMRIYDSHGKYVKQAGFDLNTFVPNSSIAYPVPVAGKALPKGNYMAAVTIRYAGNHVVRHTVSFEVTEKSLKQTFGKVTTAPGAEGGFPTLAVIVVLLAVLLLAGATVKNTRMRRQRAALIAARERDLAELERLRLVVPGEEPVPLDQLPPPDPSTLLS